MTDRNEGLSYFWGSVTRIPWKGRGGGRGVGRFPTQSETQTRRNISGGLRLEAAEGGGPQRELGAAAAGLEDFAPRGEGWGVKEGVEGGGRGWRGGGGLRGVRPGPWILERVQYANMDDWRMDCPWWLGLTVIPVKRSASLLSMYHASNDCTIEIEGP